MIEITNLTKKFGSTIAVNNLNLHIKKGELFVFLGPNGAGKTTTIKLITGLLKSTSGQVKVKGHDMEKEPVEAKKVLGYISDHPYLYEKLTAREFLQFVSGLYGVENFQKKMDELMDVFTLKGWEDYLIENFSHGMRQKIAISSALIHDPDILIIDEPMVALDPHSSQYVKTMLKEKVRQNKTVFLSTHTLSLAEEIATRIGIIHHGNLLCTGTMQEIKKDSQLTGNLEEVFIALTQDETDLVQE